MPSAELFGKIVEKVVPAVEELAARSGAWTRSVPVANRAGSASSEVRIPGLVPVFDQWQGLGVSPAHVNLRRFELDRDGILIGPKFSNQVAETPSTWASIYEKRHAVVRVGTEEGQGSGFIIHDRLAATADHVIANHETGAVMKDLAVRLSDGSIHRARLLARAPQEDVALLEIPSLGDQVPKIKLAETRTVENKEIYTIAHPMSSDDAHFSNGRPSGFIIGAHNPGNAAHNTVWLDTSLPAWTGSSGGPMLSGDGLGIGLIAKTTYAQTSGPAAAHIRLVAEAASKSMGEKGWLEFAAEARLDGAGSFTLHQLTDKTRWINQ